MKFNDYSVPSHREIDIKEKLAIIIGFIILSCLFINSNL